VPYSDLRRLLRVPLQAYGQEASPASPVEAFVPSHIVLNVKRLAAARLRISMSPAHDIAHLLHLALAEQLEIATQKERRSWPESQDWRGRELRRMLRTWTPQSHVDVAMHPANLRFLPPDEEMVVSCWAPHVERDTAMSLAMLAAPVSRDTASQVLAALVTHLALAELRGAARSLHQKRLSRNALPASASPAGPQPAAPPGRLPFRRPNLRPAPQRVLLTRRNLRFAGA